MVEQLAPQGRPQLSLARTSVVAICPCQRLPAQTRHAQNLFTWPAPRHMSLSHIHDHGTYASVSFKSDGGADSISFHHWSLCACYDSRFWIVGGLKPKQSLVTLRGTIKFEPLLLDSYWTRI